MIEPQAGRLFIGPVGTPEDELTEVGSYTARDLDRALGGGTIASHSPKREMRQRIAFRHPAAGLDPERLIGGRVDSLTLHGVNLAGPGLVIVSAEPVDDGTNLWIVAERWEGR
jgi:hypothetical protein